MSAIEDANRHQLAASDPAVSSFVAASAGSGKTKLLTDRLLRLMLAGTAPEKILCLTYTKAAAAEMRIRLNRRLGEWVAMPEVALAAKLRALNVRPEPETLARARKLFAEVLDLPGGMRIETIHAFCQSLLRRFPLEARLSPHFTVADDEAAAQRLREAREDVLASPAARAAVGILAAEIDELRFAELSGKFVEGLELKLLNQPPEAMAETLRASLAVENEGEAVLLEAFVSSPREAELREYLRAVSERGNPSGQKWAFAALDWLAGGLEERVLSLHVWESVCLTTAGEIRTLRGYCGKALANLEPAIKAEFTAEAQRILLIQDKLKLIRLLKINNALLEILLPVAGAERNAKTLAAELSYGDLIGQTSELLIDPGAAWVLYKLDGGIEHLLLDEVQDTAPRQWEIANAIAAEFFAGEGAKEAPRSIFAVGDPKQSIFSFQGADLKSFDLYKEKFKASATGAGRSWLDGALSVSFRSTAPVLKLTDAVFAEGFARNGVVAPGDTLSHGVSRVGQAGVATLWPLTEAAEAEEIPDWDLPEDYQSAESSIAILARKLGDYIEQRLTRMLPAKNRLARPGDFLILVRSRGAIVGAITSELKSRKIDVAGLDRMVLPEQPAVADMLALCDALLLPEDDLAFAQFLVSPLGGLSDESLMELAMNRPGSLVGALYARADERAEWQAPKAFYEALRARADFDTPFVLLADALGVLGGRARLLSRFGPEAAEPLDELLAEALQFSATEPGSLQSFVQRLRLSGQAIKRESEAGGDEVRIMTVHGAKGLQAPIVILPDTVGLPKAETGLLWLETEAGKLPVFCPRAELRASSLAQAQAALRDTQIEEYNRLLYVALTRAEDEILICGAAGRKAIPGDCWYEAVKAGFARLPARQTEDGAQVYDCPQEAPPDGASEAREKPVVSLPPWAGAAPDWRATPPAKEQTVPERIVPSRIMEETSRAALAISPLAGPQTPAAKREAAMARGTAVHALLQHLPNLPESLQADTALAYLRAQPALAPEAKEICASVLKILHDPALEALFGQGSSAEVPLAGVVAGREVGGAADRVFVGAEEIIVADYKTDRNPPLSPSGIPEKYAVQLAAYRAVLRQIYPGRPVRCVLVWTAWAEAMAVPDAMLDKAALA
ncbi:MAG: double-strand break repair helicase AddA [Proteobacteria bacterium]|nr:double-strand break repair helicase AddA [Pseudomonadota bacterium]MBU6426056.1 double-strand break repair helicase AddA [Rhodospirillales bacterium]